MIDITSEKRDSGKYPESTQLTMGTETLRYRGINIWDLVRENIKESETLQIFKNKIKECKLPGCTCRLCKDYIFNLGYL